MALISRFEEWVRSDPGRRGLLANSGTGPGVGSLLRASTQLRSQQPRACLVTGFSIPHGDSVRAETDGPLGTVFLGRVLFGLGFQALIVTDPNCQRVVEVAASVSGLPSGSVLVLPSGDAAERRRVLSHVDGGSLISIERVGPSHDSRSVRLMDGEAMSVEFESVVPIAERNVCHNMRGESIDHLTGDLHLLFEEAHQSFPGIRTIGIGDGGNEIGMGAFPWSQIRALLSGPQAARVPCRIPCHETIVAGTSNWGAYALAASFALDRSEVLEPLTVEAERNLLERLVEAGAVDGVTRRAEATVDGLPFLTYIQPLIAIRRALGLSP